MPRDCGSASVSVACPRLLCRAARAPYFGKRHVQISSLVFAGCPNRLNLYNGRVNPGEHMRVFPLSNWTELDVWQYIRREKLAVPPIYFSHARKCLRRHGQWLPASDLLPRRAGEEVRDLVVRVRTIGDIISTGMVESRADSVDDIIAEIATARVTERGSRADDRTSEAAMEDRKKAGYF